MTYDELKQIINDFAIDAEPSFISHIPDFIRATEKRIVNDADLPLTQNQTMLATTAGADTITAPDDFLSPDTMAVSVSGSLQFLLAKSTDFLQTAYPDASLQGVPRYYSVKNALVLQIAPTPDATYPVQFRYYGYPTSITAGSGTATTWLSENYEFALQYGALRDAAAYLKEDADVVANYEKLYLESLGQLKAFGIGRSRLDRYRVRG